MEGSIRTYVEKRKRPIVCQRQPPQWHPPVSSAAATTNLSDINYHCPPIECTCILCRGALDHGSIAAVRKVEMAAQ